MQELAENPELEPVAMLAKPYATDQLLDTVKEVPARGVRQKTSIPAWRQNTTTPGHSRLSDTLPAASWSGTPL